MNSDLKRSDLTNYLQDVKHKYEKAKEGHIYDFETDIQPFLNHADKIASSIESISSDRYYNSDTKFKLSQQITELAMACHKKELKQRLFTEKYKFISMWFNYVINEDLV